MNLATWSIRNPIPSILLFIMLTLAGVAGFQKLGIQDLPDLDYRPSNWNSVSRAPAPPSWKPMSPKRWKIRWRPYVVCAT